MPASTYLRNELLDHIFSVGAYAMPTDVYFALFETATDADDAGVETTDAGYSRQAMTMDTASGGSITNLADIDVPFTNQTDLEGWGIYDAATVGNLLLFGDFDETLTVTAGGTLSWAAGEFNERLI